MLSSADLSYFLGRSSRRVGERTGLVVAAESCLPPDLMSPAVRVLPLHIIFDQRSFRDGVDITTDRFYELLRTSPTMPTTSIPSPAEYLEAIRNVDGDAVLVLTTHERLSGMFGAAALAARLYRDEKSCRRVEVFDTCTAAAGFGLAVRVALEGARAGLGIDTVLRRLQACLPEISMLGALSSLKYVARGGRLRGIPSTLVDHLGVRAMFALSEGRIQRIGFARSDDGAIDRLLSYTAVRFGHARLWTLAFHTSAPDPARRLDQRAREVLQIARSEFCRLPAVVGAHAGPGLFGLAALPMEALSGGKL